MKIETNSINIHLLSWAEYDQPDPIARVLADQGENGWECVGMRQVDSTLTKKGSYQ